MFKIRRFYNQNRRMIWTVVIALTIIILVIQVLNSLAEKQMAKNSSSNLITATNVIDDNSYSVITNEKIETKVALDINNIISEFFEKCNSGNMKEAYNLLSNECKEELYPTLNDFLNKYANAMFETDRIYNAQAWIKGQNCTYKIKITEDILSNRKYKQ